MQSLNRTTKGYHIYTPPNSKYSYHFTLLSHKQLSFIESIEHPNQQLFRTLHLSLLLVEDEQGFPEELWFTNISPKELLEVGKHILELSIVSEETYKELEESAKIHFSDQLKGDNWKCETCKRKRLQSSRACPFIEETNRNKDFVMSIGGVLYRTCPVGSVNEELVSQAIEAFNIFETKVLPDAGGFFDQTRFFYVSVGLIGQLVAEQREMELKKQKGK